MKDFQPEVENYVSYMQDPTVSIIAFSDIVNLLKSYKNLLKKGTEKIKG